MSRLQASKYAHCLTKLIGKGCRPMTTRAISTTRKSMSWPQASKYVHCLTKWCEKDASSANRAISTVIFAPATACPGHFSQFDKKYSKSSCKRTSQDKAGARQKAMAPSRQKLSQNLHEALHASTQFGFALSKLHHSCQTTP